MSRAVRRIGPLQHRDLRSRSSVDDRGDATETFPQLLGQPRSLLTAVDGLGDDCNRVDDVLECGRVDRQHASVAAEVVHRLINSAQFNSAHGTQVLRHHQLLIDLGRREAGGQRRVGHHPPIPGLSRKVAFKCHTDNLVARTESKEDLGSGRQQRHDAHRATLAIAGSPHRRRIDDAVVRLRLPDLPQVLQPAGEPYLRACAAIPLTRMSRPNSNRVSSDSSAWTRRGASLCRVGYSLAGRLSKYSCSS